MAAKQPAWKKSRMSFGDLAKRIENESKRSGNSDDRFYYPQLDENKNGSAVIRFLPPAEGEDAPWVKVYSHGFKETGGWYIEECPTTIGNDCPACKDNGRLWNSGIESDKEIARKRKRRTQYIANILVIQDPKNPENEGKVFLFKFGAKIFDKIKDAMFPEFEEDGPAINPFDFTEGANFMLRIRKYEGNVNYDKSKFEEVSPIADDDKTITDIYEQLHPLKEFVSPERFKSWDDLSARLDRVLGSAATTRSAADLSEEEDDLPHGAGISAGSKTATPKEEPVVGAEPGEEDEALDYFRKLAAED